MAPRKPQPVVRPVKFKREVFMSDDMMSFYLLRSSLNLKSMHYNPHVLDFPDGSKVTLWIYKSWNVDQIGLEVIKRTIAKWIYKIDKVHSCFVDLRTETVNFKV